MLNLHYNGDIVNTPDKEYANLAESKRRRVKSICKYGKFENECIPFQNCLTTYQNIKRTGQSKIAGECPLSKKICCPGYFQSVINGLKEKKFRIDYTQYRKLASASHYLVKTSEHKVLFLTLTFPKFKKDEITDKQANECFSKFIENLRTNYQCSGYIAVRERGKNTNRLHFHLLVGLPYTNFCKLNGAWLSAISDYCIYSKRALYSDKRARFILDPIRATKYVCKYFSKVKDESKTRIYFISNNLIIKPQKFKPEDHFYNFNDFFEKYRMEVVSISDYHTTYRAENPEYCKKLFNEIIYPLFGTTKRGKKLIVRDNIFKSESG